MSDLPRGYHIENGPPRPVEPIRGSTPNQAPQRGPEPQQAADPSRRPELGQRPQPAEPPTPYTRRPGEHDAGYFARIAAHDKAMNESVDGKPPLAARLRAEKIDRLADAFDPNNHENGARIRDQRLQQKSAEIRAINTNLSEAEAKRTAEDQWLANVPDLPRDLGPFEGRPELLQWASEYLHMTPRETQAHFEQVVQRNEVLTLPRDEREARSREYTLAQWGHVRDDELALQGRQAIIHDEYAPQQENPFNITDDMAERAARAYGLTTLDSGRAYLEEQIRFSQEHFIPKKKLRLARLHTLHALEDQEAVRYAHASSPVHAVEAEKRHAMGLPYTEEQQKVLDGEGSIQFEADVKRETETGAAERASKAYRYMEVKSPLGPDDQYREPSWYGGYALRHGTHVSKPYNGDYHQDAKNIALDVSLEFSKRGIPRTEPHQKNDVLDKGATKKLLEGKSKLPPDLSPQVALFIESKARERGNNQDAVGFVNEATRVIAEENNVPPQEARQYVIRMWDNAYKDEQARPHTEAVSNLVSAVAQQSREASQPSPHGVRPAPSSPPDFPYVPAEDYT